MKPVFLKRANPPQERISRMPSKESRGEEGDLASVQSSQSQRFFSEVWSFFKSYSDLHQSSVWNFSVMSFFFRKKWPFWSRQPHFLFWNIRKSETLTWTDFKTKHLSARKRNLSPCQLIFLKTIKNLKLCDPMPAYEEKQINCGLNFPLKHLLQLVLAYSFRTKGIKSYLTGFQKLVFIAFCSNPPDFVLKPFYTNNPHRWLQLPPFSVSKLV